MTEVIDSSGLSIAGNPSDDEIAAIAAAYSYLLSRSSGISLDNLGKNSELWPISGQLTSAHRARPSAKSLSWAMTYRLLARGTMR